MVNFKIKRLFVIARVSDVPVFTPKHPCVLKRGAVVIDWAFNEEYIG